MEVTVDLGKVGLTPCGDWSSNTQYERLSIVAHNGTSWLSKSSNRGVEPGTDSSVWMKLVEPVSGKEDSDPSDPVDVDIPFIAVAAPTFSFGKTGGMSSIVISCGKNDEWTFSGIPSWVTVSKKSGKGPASVPISCGSTTESRSATFFLNGTIPVTIAQGYTSESGGGGDDGGDDGGDVQPGTAYISASETQFGASGGNAYVTITADSTVAWRLVADSGIALLKDSGIGSTNVYFTVPASASGKTYQIKLTNTAGVLYGSVTLTQAAQESVMTLTLDTDATITGNANAEFHLIAESTDKNTPMILSSYPTWLQVVGESTASSPAYFTFKTTENSTGSQRTGAIVVAQGEKTKSIAITQNAASSEGTWFLSASSTRLSVDGGAATIHVIAPNGSAFSLDAPEDFVFVGTPSGTGTGARQSFTFNYDGNSDAQAYTFTVKLLDGNNVQKTQITFTQPAAGSDEPIDYTEELSISVSKSQFDATNAGNCSMNIVSDSPNPWTITSVSSDGMSGNDAVYIPERSGTGRSQQWIYPQNNAGQLSRTITITVSREDASGLKTRSVTLNQYGLAETWTLTAATQEGESIQSLPAAGTTLTLSLRSSLGTASETEWIASNNNESLPSWFQMNPSRQFGQWLSIPVTILENTGIQERNCTLQIRDTNGTLLASLDILQAPAQEASFGFLPSSISLPAEDDLSAQVEITAPTGAAWSLAVSESWVSITEGASGTGTGRAQIATITLSANSGSARSAYLYLKDDNNDTVGTIEISQAAYEAETWTVTHNVPLMVPAERSTYTANLVSSKTNSSTAWVTQVVGGIQGAVSVVASGTGTTRGITVTVAANPDAARRQGTIRFEDTDGNLLGSAIIIRQEAAQAPEYEDPSFEISPARIGADGGTFAITIHNPDEQAWELITSAGDLDYESSEDWPNASSDMAEITLTVPASTPSGAITVQLVDSTPGSAAPVFQEETVYKDALTIETAIDGTAGNAISTNLAGGTYGLAVTSTSSSVIRVSSDNDWITVVGVDSTHWNIVVANSMNNNTRIGTVTIVQSGVTKTVTVTQTGANIELAINVTNLNPSASAHSSDVSASVTAAADVSWTLSSNMSWCRPGRLSGTGPYSFAIVIDANEGGVRTALLTLTDGTTTKYVYIQQGAGGGDASSNLSLVTQGPINLPTEPQAADDFNVEISDPQGEGWYLITSVDWLHFDVTEESFPWPAGAGEYIQGTGAHITTMYADTNDGAARQGSIALYDSNYTIVASITVIQSGN